MADGRSRRRYRRLTLRIDVEYEADGETRRDVATTLGAGGLFIATEEPLEEGSELLTRFHVPGGSTLHEISGRVVWSHRKGGEGRPDQTSGMGICFSDPASSALLAADLEALIVQQELDARRKG
jgi:uncharacterized protein (TIGR02266 family)